VSLPDTSFVAQAGQWLWTRLRYLLFRQLHPWVVPAAGEIGGGPMLFFDYHIETLKWTESERDVPTVVAVIEDVAAICAARGIELIVVLIPEKEEVYRDWIPQAHHPAAGWPPSPLAPLTQKLQQAGIKTVNLLPVFQQATQSGQVVYWRDDTHWNPEGAGLAAEELSGLLLE
jgi:alginate O-acetyltransferase complex protein AlgJ